jgi:hypothetical protein
MAIAMDSQKLGQDILAMVEGDFGNTLKDKNKTRRVSEILIS